MPLDIGSQQPYIPVCLMSSMTVGTAYYHELDIFRRFRDKHMLKVGFLGKLAVKSYYLLGDKIAKVILRYPLFGSILFKFWLKPLLRLFKLLKI